MGGDGADAEEVELELLSLLYEEDEVARRRRTEMGCIRNLQRIKTTSVFAVLERERKGGKARGVDGVKERRSSTYEFVLPPHPS